MPVSIEPERVTFVLLVSDMNWPAVLAKVAESANAVSEAQNANEASNKTHRTFTRLPPTAKSLGHVPGDQEIQVQRTLSQKPDNPNT
jgi:hypothetical protein